MVIKKLNVKKVINILKDIKFTRYGKDILFYHSLFDISSFEEEEEFFPTQLIMRNRKEIRKIIKSLLRNKRFRGIKKAFRDDPQGFETQIIGSDVLTRILLYHELKEMGVQVTITRIKTTGLPSFDLEIKRDNIFIEIKRVSCWSNFKNYVDDFLEKSNDPSKKYLFVVVSWLFHL